MNGPGYPLDTIQAPNRKYRIEMRQRVTLSSNRSSVSYVRESRLRTGTLLDRIILDWMVMEPIVFPNMIQVERLHPALLQSLAHVVMHVEEVWSSCHRDRILVATINTASGRIRFV